MMDFSHWFDVELTLHLKFTDYVDFVAIDFTLDGFAHHSTDTRFNFNFRHQVNACDEMQVFILIVVAFQFV